MEQQKNNVNGEENNVNSDTKSFVEKCYHDDQPAKNKSAVSNEVELPNECHYTEIQKEDGCDEMEATIDPSSLSIKFSSKCISVSKEEDLTNDKLESETKKEEDDDKPTSTTAQHSFPNVFPSHDKPLSHEDFVNVFPSQDKPLSEEDYVNDAHDKVNTTKNVNEIDEQQSVISKSRESIDEPQSVICKSCESIDEPQSIISESIIGESIDSDEEIPNSDCVTRKTQAICDHDNNKKLNTITHNQKHNSNSKLTTKMIIVQYFMLFVGSLFGMQHATSRNNLSYAIFSFQALVCVINSFSACHDHYINNKLKEKTGHMKNIHYLVSLFQVALALECLANVSYYWYPVYITVHCIFYMLYVEIYNRLKISNRFKNSSF